MDESDFGFGSEDDEDEQEPEFNHELLLQQALGQVPVVDPNKPKKPRFHCAGSRRKDEDGKSVCTYKAHYKWRGPCPGDPQYMSGKARLEAKAALAAGKGCGNFFGCVPPKKGEGMGKSQSQTSASAILNFVEEKRIETGLADLNRVLGGGLCPGTTLMFGGVAGTGKSSLLLQILIYLAQSGLRPFFASGEMMEKQNLSYLKRLAGPDVPLEVLAQIGIFCDTDGVDIHDAIERAKHWKAKVFFLDSLHLSRNPDSSANQGSADQVDAVTQYVSSYSQKKNVASVIISHLNKQEDFKGAQTAQHAVDGLLMIDKLDVLGDDGRLLRGTSREDESTIREIYWKGKSRLGPSSAKAFFQTTEEYRFEPLSDFVRLKMAKLSRA